MDVNSLQGRLDNKVKAMLAALLACRTCGETLSSQSFTNRDLSMKECTSNSHDLIISGFNKVELRSSNGCLMKMLEQDDDVHKGVSSEVWEEYAGVAKAMNVRYVSYLLFYEVRQAHRRTF